ncbi:ABC transporter permease [Endozoicomonas atrinae]|uniref:ABC transporter permease n=1 Tax=Endozoicomonas atrinae TaxID=1333660 RepID=UPI003B00C819
MLGMFRSLWNYRYFVLSSIRNELITRFIRSRLGGLWMIINPLAQVAIYALILSNVIAAKLPGIDNKYAYAIYLMAGLLAWTLFNDIVSRCLNLFIEQGNLMKKMQFPKITLPAIVVGFNLVNNLLLFTAMTGIFVVLGHGFTFAMLWLTPLTMALAAFALSVGLILGIMNVFIRDIGQAVPIIMQVWFWFTPIVYSPNVIPGQYRYLLQLNPVYHFTSAYQQVIVYGQNPQMEGLLVISILSVVLLTVSLFLFRRASEEMVDVL